MQYQWYEDIWFYNFGKDGYCRTFYIINKVTLFSYIFFTTFFEPSLYRIIVAEWPLLYPSYTTKICLFYDEKLYITTRVSQSAREDHYWCLHGNIFFVRQWVRDSEIVFSYFDIVDKTRRISKIIEEYNATYINICSMCVCIHITVQSRWYMWRAVIRLTHVIEMLFQVNFHLTISQYSRIYTQIHVVWSSLQSIKGISRLTLQYFYQTNLYIWIIIRHICFGIFSNNILRIKCV